ncbi:hypothetical protein CKO42_02970 [Lamprobacter modestohalophilus]|uniref:Uncharacterized protein n=1 Tax=Lamprobacter modestohalophilus TaxID=1064514 RepID=A0A9X0W5Y5_9GAMM|nr:hypothetical protein [Lamprobacter modestohalophilus]
MDRLRQIKSPHTEVVGMTRYPNGLRGFIYRNSTDGIGNTTAAKCSSFKPDTALIYELILTTNRIDVVNRCIEPAADKK